MSKLSCWARVNICQRVIAIGCLPDPGRRLNRRKGEDSMTKSVLGSAFRAVIVLLLLPGVFAASEEGACYPGVPPSVAEAELSDTGAILKNNLLKIEYCWDAAKFALVFKNLSSQVHFACGAAPVIVKLDGGQALGAAELQVFGKAEQVRLEARPDAYRLAEHYAGWEIRIPFRTPDAAVEVLFTATLRDGSNYVTQRVTITPRKGDLALDTITILDLEVENAGSGGETQGAPALAPFLFFAYENPMSENSGKDGRVTCSLYRGSTLKENVSLAASCVLGVTPPDQRRRAFLHYVERERAHPYRPFLHYNSWYDIAWGDRKFNEAQALEAIGRFGEELTVKRGVALQSFVFDDGWDDNRTLWQFHEGFPNGFIPPREKAARYGSAVGTWLSPFGGYGDAREQRLAFGREQGFETNDAGFSMAGPRYYARFKAICEEMIREYGVNFFKFDGMGAGLGAGEPGSRNYLEDVDALMRLTDELRAIAPDLYISATTGTWASPWFLWHADNIWRGAGDMGFSGQGSKRQQWINYRDTWTYRNIVRKGPLYPLNALMTQGIVQSRHGSAAELGSSDAEMANEIWSFFGSGTSLQELYIAPGLLNPVQWDTLARAAGWARDNARVLVDTHWVGGDPGENKVYGWAAWTPEKATLVLRNPAEQQNRIDLVPGKALELPEGAPGRFRVSTPRQDQRPVPVPVLDAGESFVFELAPFEVLVFELFPEQSETK